MSQIAELKKVISEKTKELEKSTEEAIKNELSNLKDATKSACESVESELQSAMQRQLKIIKYMTLSITGAWLILMSLIFGGTLLLATLYIKPEELKTQLEQRMDLEKSGMLVKGSQESFVVMPPQTKCWTSDQNQKVCELPN